MWYLILISRKTEIKRETLVLTTNHSEFTGIRIRPKMFRLAQQLTLICRVSMFMPNSASSYDSLFLAVQQFLLSVNFKVILRLSNTVSLLGRTVTSVAMWYSSSFHGAHHFHLKLQQKKKIKTNQRLNGHLKLRYGILGSVSFFSVCESLWTPGAICHPPWNLISEWVLQSPLYWGIILLYKAGNADGNKMDQRGLSLLVEMGKSSEINIYWKQALDLLDTEGTFL